MHVVVVVSLFYGSTKWVLCKDFNMIENVYDKVCIYILYKKNKLQFINFINYFILVKFFEVGLRGIQY